MSASRILIVGGGIAGLATAAGLARAGIACEVVERTDRWQPLGAGIVLGVNAMRVMRDLGLADAVIARGARLGEAAIADQEGRTLGATDFGALEPEFGPSISLHRAALHDVLMDGAGDVPMQLGTSVDAIAQCGDHVEVRLTDGREERYALVVGADGIRSRVRQLILGELPLRYSGYTCWRLVVNISVDRPRMCEMWGRGQRFGLVTIDAERLYGFAVAYAPRGQGDRQEGKLARFRERFARFGGAVPEVLAALQHPDELIHNDLEELPACPWYRGRVVLIGDAAHALTPNMGQGAAMALEDSLVLVELLRAGRSIPEVLASLVARRDGRVRWVQNQSRRIGRIGQLEGALVCKLRNAALRLVPDGRSTAALRKIASQAI